MFSSRDNYFKFTLFSVIFVFLFLTLGTQFFHNHSDSEFHQDCPVCIWLINAVFIFSVFLILFGLLLNSKVNFGYLQIVFPKSYKASLYLRSPPALV